jgi:hypothetical protein
VQNRVKLKGVFILEIAIIIGLLVGAITFLLLMPELGSTQQYESLDSYTQKTNPIHYITIIKDQPGLVRFNYTSYDPSIIVLDLYFDSIEKPGDFDIFCNYKHVTTVTVTPESKNTTINLVSFSGLDWVEPLTSMFGLNDLVFESSDSNGFLGTISYQISFRGSR